MASGGEAVPEGADHDLAAPPAHRMQMMGFEVWMGAGIRRLCGELWKTAPWLRRHISNDRVMSSETSRGVTRRNDCEEREQKEND